MQSAFPLERGRLGLPLKQGVEVAQWRHDSFLAGESLSNVRVSCSSYRMNTKNNRGFVHKLSGGEEGDSRTEARQKILERQRGETLSPKSRRRCVALVHEVIKV